MSRYKGKITYRVLIIIAIIFALLAGFSTLAWLLPTSFNSFGANLVELTGSEDILLNVRRIGNNPIPYTVIFAILALGLKWFAGKFR